MSIYEPEQLKEYLSSLSDYEASRLGVVFLGLSWAKERGHPGHLKAGQLVSAIADAAEDKWGVMAPVVLAHLGAGTSMAIGELVSDLLEKGLLSADESDKAADFASGPDLVARFDIARYPWAVPFELL